MNEVFNTFLSIRPIALQVELVITKLLNPVTGESYEETTVDTPEIDAGSRSTPSTNACAACFVCQIPELRAVFLLVSAVVGCMLDRTHYTGRVEQDCLTNGSYYVSACGPRTSDLFLSNTAWRSVYTEHRDIDFTLAQSYAERLATLAQEQGGEMGMGHVAHRASIAWTKRDISLGEDQGADFMR
eukprot:5228298-Prymnesium_polylepis.1